jgi:hypothetical protein
MWVRTELNTFWGLVGMVIPMETPALGGVATQDFGLNIRHKIYQESFPKILYPCLSQS